MGNPGSKGWNAYLCASAGGNLANDARQPCRASVIETIKQNMEARMAFKPLLGTNQFEDLVKSGKLSRR